MGHRAASELGAEQAELLALLRQLNDAQWAAPSLCAGWTVGDVVAHLVAWDELLAYRRPAEYAVTASGHVRRLVAARFSVDRLNARLLDRARGVAPDEWMERLDHARTRPRRLFDRVAPNAQLAEFVVHQQDIRRALGLHRAIPAERLHLALDGVRRLPGVDVARRGRGLRLRATDVEWASGQGPEVSGPAEALLLALAGRRAVLAELAGPGRAALDGRLDGSREDP